MGDAPAWDGLDADRPLPAALRGRLEAALLAAAADAAAVPGPDGDAGADEGDADLTAVGLAAAGLAVDGVALDHPRPLPDGVRARLEETLASSAGVAAGVPVAIPPPRRTGASGGSDGRGRRPVWLHPGLAVAAVVTLVLASVGLLPRGGDGDREVTAAGPEITTTTTGAPPPPTATTTGPVLGSGETVGPAAAPSATTSPASRTVRRPTTPTTGAPAPAGGEAPVAPTPPRPGGDPSEATPAPSPGGTGVTTDDGSADAGAPPPYAFPPTASDEETQGAMAPGSEAAPPSSSSPAPAPARAAPPTGGASLRIGVFGGDAAQEAGFRAYVDLMNRDGGLRGRTVELVPTGPGTAATGTIATVNLSPRPVASPGGAPAWVTGPLLETLTATEDILPGGGRVFSFASPPERQAHLAADAVFPQLAPTATAVIYRPVAGGPLRDTVPGAFEEVLAERGVRVTVHDYDPAGPPPALRDADAAFLSLDTDSARAWLRQAKAAGYSPARGVAGIATLFDPALLTDLPDGTRVVSPYVVPAGAEGDAIRTGAGGTSAASLHGWATAKSLAVALWRSAADTPDEARAALDGLTGYDSGLAQPYETRPGTRSRTPEGVVFAVRSGAFAADGAFRRDPH